MVLDALRGIQTDIVVGEIHLAGPAVRDKAVNVIFLLHGRQSGAVKHLHLCLDSDLRQNRLERGGGVVVLGLGVNGGLKAIRVTCFRQQLFGKIQIILIELCLRRVSPGIGGTE